MIAHFLLGLVVVASILIAIAKWPQIGLAIQVVGIMFATIAIYYLGRRAGVSYALLAIVLFGTLVFILKERVPVFKFSPQEILAMILALFMAFTLLYTPTPLYGTRKVQLFVAVCVVLVAVSRMFGSTRERMEKTLKVLAWVSVLVLVLYTFFFIIGQQVAIGEERFAGGEGLVGNVGALFLSWTGATAVVLTSYLIISCTHLWTKIFAAILMFCGVVVIVATGSRGPFVALLAGAAFTFLGRKALIRYALLFVLVVALIFAGLYFAPSFGRERIMTAFEKHSLEQSGRADFYRLGWGHYLSNPVIGGGAGSFADYVGGGDRITYPHNLFLEIGGETGTIGLVLMLAMLGFCVRPILRLRSKQEPLTVASKIIQWLFWVGLANAMVSFDIPEQRTLFASIGFLAAVRQWPRVEEEMDEQICIYSEEAYEPYPSLGAV